MTESRILKSDLLGAVRLTTLNGISVVVRDCAASSVTLRWLARRLMQREARAMALLADIDGVPQLVQQQQDCLLRSYIAAQPMQLAKPTGRAYFNNAARLLRRIHAAGVAHNDLSKEPNWLVREDGRPAIIDFQLAFSTRRRGKFFRLAAREDLRHLLKHKRTYCPQYLTTRERRILSSPGWASIAIARTIKPIYLFVTRSLLGWEDREGGGDREPAARVGTRR
ncbi:MAG: serine/threonine protein kinase [Gammaproteobacteria bacterium]|nr:serine/threonine protein kinase [Gammaproteobacteria bacterium]MDH5302542.1 serine/threonine protein kinase [Gammaproteobacteria bacterium]MDH5321910.1 serine/threonine protein kinase [Gammaproteobacteria bacterium]